MIIKTNKKDKNGKDVYRNVLTGEEGIIGQLNFQKSRRRENREIIGWNKQRPCNNRKSKGETFIQQVRDKNGKVHTIQHLTNPSIQRKLSRAKIMHII